MMMKSEKISSEKVSVVIRTRSRPASLCQAIESVLSQTWHNIEIIVVNDGLNVNLRQLIINNYGGEYARIRNFIEKGRIKLLDTETKGNRSHAANIGWRSAAGELVLFLDDDDLLLKNHITELIRCLRKKPWCSIAFSGALKEDCNGKRIPLKIQAVDLLSLAKENLFPLHCALVRKSALEAVKGFDESIEMFEDWDLWLSLLVSGFEFIGVGQWTAVYRMHNTGNIKNIVSNNVSSNNVFLNSTSLNGTSFGSAGDIKARWKVIIKHEDQIRMQLAAMRDKSPLHTFMLVIFFKIMKRLL